MWTYILFKDLQQRREDSLEKASAQMSSSHEALLISEWVDVRVLFEYL